MISQPAKEPFFVLLFDVLIQKQPVMGHKILALLLAFGGLVLIVWDGSGTLNLWGVVLSITAGLCYAGLCSSMATKPLQRVSGYTLSAWGASASALVFLVFSAVQGDPLIIQTARGWVFTG